MDWCLLWIKRGGQRPRLLLLQDLFIQFFFSLCKHILTCATLDKGWMNRSTVWMNDVGHGRQINHWRSYKYVYILHKYIYIHIDCIYTHTLYIYYNNIQHIYKFTAWICIRVCIFSIDIYIYNIYTHLSPVPKEQWLIPEDLTELSLKHHTSFKQKQNKKTVLFPPTVDQSIILKQ